VTITPPFGPGVIVNPDITPGVSQLRVEWDVSKGIGGSSGNTCSVRVYNLGASSRKIAAGIVRRAYEFDPDFAFLDGRLEPGADVGGGTLTLKARYQASSSTASLFEGTATAVKSENRRNTWTTTIVGTDGMLQTSSAIADKFWAGTVPAVNVLTYLVTRVMVAPLATPYPPEIAADVFVGGVDTTNIYASAWLDDYAAKRNFEWWIDDGAVFFSSPGAALPQPPIILTPNGAPGSTRMLSKPRPVEGGKVEVPALMLPEMRPKSPVTVVAADLGGAYFASAVRHTGSNSGSSRVSRTIATLTPLGVAGLG